MTQKEYTEEQAFMLVNQLARKFGWRYAIFCEDDIKQTWADIAEREIMPEEMERVKSSRMWCKSLDDAICREGMEVIYEIVNCFVNEI